MKVSEWRFTNFPPWKTKKRLSFKCIEKLLDPLRFIELFNDMFKSRYAPRFVTRMSRITKQGVNNHANLHGAPNVTVTYSMCRLTTHAPPNYDKHWVTLCYLCLEPFSVPVNHTRSTNVFARAQSVISWNCINSLLPK